jgi:hypothetical protein
MRLTELLSMPLRRGWLLAPGLLAASLLAAPGAGASAESPSLALRLGPSYSQHYGNRERGLEYEVQSGGRTSITGGISLYLPVTDRFGLQQEICYVRKGSRQAIGVDVLEIPTVLDVTYDLDYVEIPVLLRFNWKTSGAPTLYSLAGFALSLKVHDRYTLQGEVDDGTQVVPLHADAAMPEVDLFDFGFVYGMGAGLNVAGRALTLEYRFTIGWNTLAMPTYAYVPFEDEEILVDNPPVPLRNQSHWVTLGVRL